MIRKSLNRALTGAAALFLMMSGAWTGAAAEEVTVIGSSGKWSAYSLTEDGNRVCYMASEPVSEKGNYTKRGQVFALVTHRPADKTFNVVSIVPGYSYKENSTVDVRIGNKKYTLYTWGNRAWAQDADDAKIVDAMVRGSTMVIKGYSERGTLTTDTYSLSGFTATRNMINKACDAK